MRILSEAGRIFYGIAMVVLGFQTIYDQDFPYMLIPPDRSWSKGLALLPYISGSLLVLAGTCIILKWRARPVLLVLGFLLLVIFCFYFTPYEFLATTNYLHLVEWDNPLKELALASGAFIIAGCFFEKGEVAPIRFLGKLIPLATICFAIIMISFGILHFQHTAGVAAYIPSWIPFRIFWAYFGGAALIGSGVAIIFKIKSRLISNLLGAMILSWFVILHIPKVIDSSFDRGEITSAFIALAYSGIAFVISSAPGSRSPG